ETLARPLFEPTRRAAEIAPVAQQSGSETAAAESAPRHMLLGVVSSPDRSIAVMSIGDARLLRVETGAVVDGWKVVRIAPTEVTIARGSQQVTLTLFRR